jgi:hypothetical protein
MARKSDAFSATFMAGLRRDTARWKSELSLLDADAKSGGPRLETAELMSWIEAGEAIFARYEKRRA